MRPDRATTAPLRLARALALGACCPALMAATAAAVGPGSPGDRDASAARALFVKRWDVGTAGWGGGEAKPLSNERSCVACHHQGGVGGAGGNDRNVSLLVASPIGRREVATLTGPGSEGIFGGNLVDLHPGFRLGASVVLHKHAAGEEDRARLAQIGTCRLVAGAAGSFSLERSARSTPALFGAGRVDAVPDAALLAAAARTFPDFPEVRGRVSRLPDGRLGRFGWKGQTAHLDEFVRAACANELGLEVPGAHRPTLDAIEDEPGPDPGLDLDARGLARLTRFVADLPAPGVRPSGAADWGAEVFVGVGCATCHAPSLGGVDGLYSDLLLHDLGSANQASGGGYGAPASSAGDLAARKADAPTPLGPARPTEWRTPPLWGVASSAPYLHDGRAPTLHRAILLHGGEAGPAARRYRDLTPADRASLLAFLRSLVAPPSTRRAEAPRLALGPGF